MNKCLLSMACVRNMRLVFFAAVLFLIAFLVWRITTLHMADLAFGEEGVRSNDITNQTLTWNPGHPEALLQRALSDNDVTHGMRVIQHLVSVLPYDGRLYAILAKQYSINGEVSLASRVMFIAMLMTPQRTGVQLDAASYWLQQGDIGKGLGYLDLVLSKDTQSYKHLFPIILQFLERAESRPLVVELLLRGHSWVNPFLVYALVNSGEFELVRAVVERYKSSQTDISWQIQNALVRRLQKENLWTDAYFNWLSALSVEQLRYNGYVFNGDFELSPSLSAGGFDWALTKAPGIEVNIIPAAGFGGSSALNIRFLGLKTPFNHVSQYMVLQPGSYGLAGKVKLDDLKAFKGVRWVVSCKDGGRVLGVTEAFSGRDDWRSFETTFSVPEKCPVQVLRLELVGRVALDFQATGGVYFDHIVVKRLD